MTIMRLPRRHSAGHQAPYSSIASPCVGAGAADHAPPDRANGNGEYAEVQPDPVEANSYVGGLAMGARDLPSSPDRIEDLFRLLTIILSDAEFDSANRWTPERIHGDRVLVEDLHMDAQSFQAQAIHVGLRSIRVTGDDDHALLPKPQLMAPNSGPPAVESGGAEPGSVLCILHGSR